MKKLLILTALVLAMTLTAMACTPIDTPADTDAPATDTNAPAADTNAPAADTNAPAADTDAPAADTDAPAADTNAPAADTNAPVADTNAPAADTNAPVADTNAPAEPATQAPVEPEPEPATQAPAQPEPEPATQAPAQPEPEPVTQAPAQPDPEPVTQAPAQPDPEPDPEPITYTIVFKNWNGDVLKSETLTAGATVTPPSAPSRAADAQYTYTFEGWSPAVATTATGNATYTATFTPTLRSYSVTLLNHDGSTLATRTVPYGGTAESYTPPARTGMTFTGYSPSLENVTGDRTCVAQFATNTYNDINVRFNYRFGAWIDNLYCGTNHVIPGQSRHNGASADRVTPTYDGWSTGADKKVTIEGWALSMLNQSELIWTVVPSAGDIPTSSTTMAGPWYSCTDGYYENADDLVLAAATGAMRKSTEPDKTFDLHPEGARYRNVQIDLSAYAGQTVNIIVAVRGSGDTLNSDNIPCKNSAVILMTLTNLHVAP